MKLSLARPISFGACLLVALTACVGPDEPHDDVPGDLLGTYKVDALMDESSCGPGALGAPDHWTFDVKLSRDESNIYWNNGDEALKGTLSGTSIFSFTSEASIPVREAKPGRPGCTLWRQDLAKGTLVVGKDGNDIPSFDGKLTYSFAQEAGSDCNDAMAEAGLAQLPCSVRYTMTATRIDE